MLEALQEADPSVQHSAQTLSDDDHRLTFLTLLAPAGLLQDHAGCAAGGQQRAAVVQDQPEAVRPLVPHEGVRPCHPHPQGAPSVWFWFAPVGGSCPSQPNNVELAATDSLSMQNICHLQLGTMDMSTAQGFEWSLG